MKFATVLLVPALLLAGCSREKETAVVTADGQEVKITSDDEGKEFNATIETKDGTATITAGQGLKADLPAGFTPYPGAEVVTSAAFGGGNSEATMVSMTTKDAPDKVIAFYRKQAEAAGLTVASASQTPTSSTIMAGKEGGASANVTASSTGEGTSITLIVGKDK